MLQFNSLATTLLGISQPRINTVSKYQMHFEIPLPVVKNCKLNMNYFMYGCAITKNNFKVFLFFFITRNSDQINGILLMFTSPTWIKESENQTDSSLLNLSKRQLNYTLKKYLTLPLPHADDGVSAGPKRLEGEKNYFRQILDFIILTIISSFEICNISN